ncbi:SurA N-terminal domain-containing protein [Tardiphaga sp. 37S4]|uniref:peptidylprolyl isomerase n=1 Tax=Tardiphaga TaxID=1395974 RepID=UPI001E3C632C|nr:MULTISPECIES: peptidylprolyl isomerase [Tardiphaga]UFS78208.1 SurA N-terminal domain-containing protein [Tardiphaga sp. 37S4]
MLRGMRKASSNWIGKTIMAVVMGVLIVSFGIWGIADAFKGYGQSKLATIGSTEITTEQFRQLYNDKLQQIGRQFGRPLTSDQARAFGLDRQVLQQVVAEAALDEDARRKGLGVGDAEVMRQIIADPNFQSPTGGFDAPRFQQLIRSLGFTEQRYIAEQRKVSLRRQIAGTVTSGVEPPKTMIEALSRYQNETRTIDYVKLDAAQAGTIEAPSPEALAAYFDERKTQFRAPEYRKIAFLALTPDEMAKWSTVSDDDARKVFEERKDKLSTPEQRQISQIVFPNVADAEAGRAKLNDTFKFEDLAKERGLSASDIDLGMVAKAGIIDPSVANAAFSLAPDGISQPITGRFGVTLVKVGKVQAGTTPSYDSVAANLKRDIAIERARAVVSDMHNKIEDERGGGANVVDTAKKLGLTAVTIEAVDRSGRTPDGQPVAGLPTGVDVVTQAFNSDVGVDNDALQAGGGYIWYDVLGVTPARDRTLDEVKPQVEARWREEQITTRLRDKAVDMAKKLESGAKLADEAAAAGLKVVTSAPFKRDASDPALSAGVIQSVFRGVKDSAGQAQGATPSEWIVYRITDVTAPAVDMASEDAKKLKETLQRGLTDEQVAQYVTRLETQIGTKINAEALAIATGAANSNTN